MTIKAVIFDLGGVLLRTTDFSPRERLAERLNMSRHDLEGFIFGGESGDKAQRGEITVQQHWQNLRRQLNCSTDEFESIIEEFFAYDELDVELIEYIRQLRKRYKTALLSNAFGDLRQVITQKWHFEDIFDTLVISAEVHLVKPDPGIFRLALDQLGIHAQEAIFVDDMRRNVEGASAVGLHAIQFQTSIQMRSDVERMLNGHR